MFCYNIILVFVKKLVCLVDDLLSIRIYSEKPNFAVLSIVIEDMI